MTPPPALGKWLFFREAWEGSEIAVVTVIAIVLLLFLWPRFVRWLESRRAR